MNAFTKICLAGLVCALIASATLAADAGASLSGASVSGGVTMIALNPQPLPPGDRDSEEDDYFRG